MVLDIDLVQTSCGYGVPLFEYVAERPTLTRWAEAKGETGLEEYRQSKNAFSIDGLPTGITGVLSEMNETRDTDVLIVGAGPTGLVLALWLTRLGVRVRVIDKTAEPGTTSRALAVQARTLEFYSQIGPLRCSGCAGTEDDCCKYVGRRQTSRTRRLRGDG